MQATATQLRHRWYPLLVAGALFLLLCSSFIYSSSQAGAKAGPLTFVGTITITGAPASAWWRDVADISGNHYYLADPSQLQVDQVDISSSTFSRAIGHGLFNGIGDSANFNFARQAPEGVLAFGGKLWVSNVHVDADGTGHSQVLVFDQKTGSLLKTISTKGQQRSDEMAVMPNLGLLVVTNPDETQDVPPEIPWVSFIRMSDYKLLTRLPFPNASPGVSGLQSPVWIGGNRVLVEVPSPIGNPNGGEIDTVIVPPAKGDTLKPFVPPGPAGHHPLPQGVNCQPAGLSLNFDSGLAAVGCGYFDNNGGGSQAIYNFRTNKFVTIIPGVQGVDIVATIPSNSRGEWHTNSGGLFIFPSYISNIMYVTDAAGHILQQIPTSDLAHTVNFDPESGEVFVPTGGGVVAVYKVSSDE